MNRTLTFLRLDFITLKPYFKSLLLMIGMGMMYAFAFKNPTYLSTMFMVWLVVAMSYPFSIGEKCGIDTLYATLTLRRRDVVSGRYIFAVSLLICGVVLAVGMQLVASLLLELQNDIMYQLLATTGACAGIYLLMVAFQYPFFFKMGYSKARLLSFIPFFLVFIVAGMVPMLQSTPWVQATQLDAFIVWFVLFIESNFVAVCLFPALLGMLAVGISYLCSCRVYEKRDV